MASDSALVVAQQLASAKLGGVVARDVFKPPAVVTALGEFAGTYGERVIKVESGHLVLQRGQAQAFELARDDADKFHLVEIPEGKVEFVRDSAGKITSIRVLTRKGTWEASLRSP